VRPHAVHFGRHTAIESHSWPLRVVEHPPHFELPLKSSRVSLCGRVAWCHPRVMGWRLQRRFSLNLSSPATRSARCVPKATPIDEAHLTPAQHDHINFYGTYSFDVETELRREGHRPLTGRLIQSGQKGPDPLRC
jgi:hypothetical protein